MRRSWRVKATATGSTIAGPTRYPESAWRASLLANLGVLHVREHGHARALLAWEQAWALAKGATDVRGRAVADFAIGEYLSLAASFGRPRADLLDAGRHAVR
jgi:hypothetical protein